MPGSVEHRSVTPLLSMIRNALRGRKVVHGLRYADELAARTQPPPNVPGGPYHKTSKVYYYTRDARRLVQPPPEIYSSHQIAAGDESTKPKHVSPAKLYIPAE